MNTNFERQPMVRWYNVKQLAHTGIKSAISGLFGNFADKREMQASLKPHHEATSKPYIDFSDRNELWMDYISDLGDGFNSTYTLAHLLAKSHLTVKDLDLKQGEILIMGGDQVYPTPDKKNYDNRLRGPYIAANPRVTGTGKQPSLLAIPGNHDWYDGLTNFMKLFCQQRSIGNWQTIQARSYWAAKLPHNTWLLGTDIQLESNIDYPQLLYYREVAANFSPGDKIILCTAEPAWVYNSLNKKDESFGKLKFFMADLGKICKDIEFRVLLTGDLHHFAHYKEIGKSDEKITHYITAGGGGAFMHPTHILRDEIETKTDVKAALQNHFPPKPKSRNLAFLNLLFPFINFGMATFLGFFIFLLTWNLQITSTDGTRYSYLALLGNLPVELRHIPYLLIFLIKCLVNSPFSIVLNLVLFFGIIAFTDNEFGNTTLNLVVAIIHGLFQILNAYLVSWILARLFFPGCGIYSVGLFYKILYSVCLVIAGGFTGSFMFGLYLLLSTLLLKSHITEAFSSFRYAGYKNFLRIHLTASGIVIYPIGIRKVTTDWKKPGGDKPAPFTGTEPNIELIGNPININF